MSAVEIAVAARDNAIGRRDDVAKMLEALSAFSETEATSPFLTEEDQLAVALSYRTGTWLALNDIRKRLDGEIKELDAQVKKLQAAEATS